MNGSPYHLLQHMPGFVGVLAGPNHVYEYVNDAYKDDLRSAPVHRALLCAKSFPSWTAKGFYELLDRVYATGETLFSLTPWRSGSRAKTTIGTSTFIYQPIRDDQASVTGIFVGGYEVTDRIKILRYRDALVKFTDQSALRTDPDEIIFSAAEILGATLKVSRVGYGIIDPVAETLHVQRDWTAPGVETLAGTLPLRAYGDFIDSLKHGEFLSISDVELDDRTASAAAALKGTERSQLRQCPRP